jgi:hypothetical protein
VRCRKVAASATSEFELNRIESTRIGVGVGDRGGGDGGDSISAAAARVEAAAVEAAALAAGTAGVTAGVGGMIRCCARSLECA